VEAALEEEGERLEERHGRRGALQEAEAMLLGGARGVKAAARRRGGRHLLERMAGESVFVRF
jgi:hypothetical protein